jgi:Tfp pilus assembly protein PilN
MNTHLIEINLSSEFERRRIKKATKVQIPAAVGAVIVVCILAFGAFYLFVFFSQESYNKMQSRLKKIKNDSVESENLQTRNKELAGQIEVLQQWYDNRIKWSEEWKQLSALIPDEAYLTAIEAVATDPKGDSLRVTLQGRATGEKGESVVLEFLDSLKEDPHFSNVYSSIEMGSITSEMNEKIFSIVMIH